MASTTIPRHEQHILIILDRSGSMECRREEVIDAFNQYLADLREEADRDGLATLVSLVTFHHEARLVFGKLEISRVLPLTRASYRPNGSTALLDALCNSVSEYRANLGQGSLFPVASDTAPPVLVLVFTDGQENSSRNHTLAEAQRLIQECEALGNWTFAYVGAAPEAWQGQEVTLFQNLNRHDARHQTVREAMTDVAQGTRKLRREFLHESKRSSVNLFEKDERDERPAEPRL